MKKNLSTKIKTQLGFTMIELLVVISILGILAVAVLSAINPIEQINRGRDTRSRSDAEQLVTSIERYNAFQQYYPWQLDENEGWHLVWDLGVEDEPVQVDDVYPCVDESGGEDRGATCGSSDDYDCSIMDRLATGDASANGGTSNPNFSCTGSNELKQSFFNRVTSTTYRTLYVYNGGDVGDSTYVCFIPQSGAFEQEAAERCSTGLPADVGDDAEDFICAGYSVHDPANTNRAAGGSVTTDTDTPMVCLP